MIESTEAYFTPSHLLLVREMSHKSQESAGVGVVRPGVGPKCPAKRGVTESLQVFIGLHLTVSFSLLMTPAHVTGSVIPC